MKKLKPSQKPSGNEIARMCRSVGCGALLIFGISAAACGPEDEGLEALEASEMTMGIAPLAYVSEADAEGREPVLPVESINASDISFEMASPCGQ